MTTPIQTTRSVQSTDINHHQSSTSTSAAGTTDQQIAMLMQMNQNLVAELRTERAMVIEVTQDRDRRLAASYRGRPEERRHDKENKVKGIVAITLGCIAVAGMGACAIATGVTLGSRGGK